MKNTTVQKRTTGKPAKVRKVISTSQSLITTKPDKAGSKGIPLNLKKDEFVESSKIEVYGKIYKTFDYDMFKVLDGNRSVHNLHFKRIVFSMSQQHLLTPILVNEKMEIIDGQHRFEASRQLEQPIYFIVAAGYSLSEVHRLNTNSKNWAPADYIQGYRSLGNKNYTTYNQFKEKYNLGHNETMAILACVPVSKKNNENFKNGTFVVGDLKKATEIADNIKMFSTFYYGYNRKAFVAAFFRMFNTAGYNHNTMISQLSTYRSKMRDCTNAKEYLGLLEDIYNHKNDKKIRFI
jgi:hypothetical protein